jgi:hypothetical protein
MEVNWAVAFGSHLIQVYYIFCHVCYYVYHITFFWHTDTGLHYLKNSHHHVHACIQKSLQKACDPCNDEMEAHIAKLPHGSRGFFIFRNDFIHSGTRGKKA